MHINIPSRKRNLYREKQKNYPCLWIHQTLQIIMPFGSPFTVFRVSKSFVKVHIGETEGSIYSHLRGSLPLPGIKSHIHRCFLFFSNTFPTFCTPSMHSAKCEPNRKLPANSGSFSESKRGLEDTFRERAATAVVIWGRTGLEEK